MKVYDGLSEYVASDEEAERVRTTLYRTDGSAQATVLAGYRSLLAATDLERFREQGYLAMEGVLTPEEVARCAAALDDLARRRPEGMGAHDEPYYQQAGRGTGPASPELRVRKLWKFAGIDPTLGAAASAPRSTTSSPIRRCATPPSKRSSRWSPRRPRPPRPTEITRAWSWSRSATSSARSRSADPW